MPNHQQIFGHKCCVFGCDAQKRNARIFEKVHLTLIFRLYIYVSSLLLS